MNVHPGAIINRIGGADRYETTSLIDREVLGYRHNGGRIHVARGNRSDAHLIREVQVYGGVAAVGETLVGRLGQILL